MSTALYIVGGLVLAAAVAYFIKKRKDKAEEQSVEPEPMPGFPRNPDRNPDIYKPEEKVPVEAELEVKPSPLPPQEAFLVEDEVSGEPTLVIPQELYNVAAKEKVFLRDLKDAPVFNGAREFHIPAGSTVAYAFNTATTGPRMYRIDFSAESEVFARRRLDTAVGDESGNEMYDPGGFLKVSFGTGPRQVNRNTGNLASRYEVTPGTRVSWLITNHGSKDAVIRAQHSSIALDPKHYKDA